jgi:Kdo2-lipid IVA lauroyltransferase/acyltransferase
MITSLSKLTSKMPLPFIHRIGSILGWLLHWLNPASARTQRQNLIQSGLCPQPAKFNEIARSNISETGKAMLETLAIWSKTEQEILALVKNVHGWHLVDEALMQKKGIIFLTPHMGCFEITSIFYGSRQPITVLFRPPKLKFLLPLILHGRQRTGVSLAEANASGVRKLMQALKKGEAVGILPDQIPKSGEGEWADFFGKPAYTMTLASKLAEKTGATVIMAFGERLANGEGFAIHLTKVDSIATPALLNQAIEQQIAQKPEQYLWQYNRYKMRRHAMKKQSRD